MVWNFFFFHSVGNFTIPTDELIFFRGVGIPPTSFFWVHVEVYEANSQPWDGLVTEVDSLLRYIIFWSWGLVTWNRSPKAPFGSNLCYPYKLYVRSYGIYQIHILYIYIYIYTLLYIYIYIHDWSVPFWNKLFGTNIHGANGPQKNRVKPTNDTSCRWSFQFYFYEKQ